MIKNRTKNLQEYTSELHWTDKDETHKKSDTAKRSIEQ